MQDIAGSERYLRRYPPELFTKSFVRVLRRSFLKGSVPLERETFPR